MRELISNYPEVAALIVLIAGIVLARYVRRAADAGLNALDERIARRSVSSRGGILSPATIRFMRNLAFWLVVGTAAGLALSLLDTASLGIAMEGFFAFFAALLVGLAIIGAGHLLGVLARHAVLRLTDDPDLQQLFGRVLYGAIMVIAIVMALTQLQIDTSLVRQLLLVVLAVILGGLALAFALGSRTHVENLLAHADLSRFSVGERIRVADQEGTIIDIHATGVDLQTDQGVASVPAAHFSRYSVIRLVEIHDAD